MARETARKAGILFVKFERQGAGFDLGPKAKDIVSSTEILAKRVSDRGFDSRFFLAEGLRELRLELRRVQPDFLGIYVESGEAGLARRACSLAREISSSTTIIAGPAVAIDPDRAVARIGADYALVSDFERAVCKVLSGKLPRKGVVLGEARAGGGHGQVGRRLLGVPAINFQDVGMGAKTAFILASRGCPYSCAFCCIGKVSGKRWIAHSPKDVSKAVAIALKSGASSITFSDDLFGFDKAWLRELCEILEREFSGLKWNCHTRVDTLAFDDLLIMKKAGCRIITYGVESGSERILKKMKKGATVAQIEKAFRETRRAGIESSAYVIIGFPGETLSDLEETRKLVFRINPGTILPTNYTDYSDIEKGKGGALFRAFPEKSYSEVARRDLFRFKRRLIVDFHFRPKKLLETLASSRGFRGFLTRMKTPFKFLLLGENYSGE